jgi:hypothetical protein
MFVEACRADRSKRYDEPEDKNHFLGLVVGQCLIFKQIY